VKLRAGTIKRLHVDQRAIRANIKGANLPPITVQTSKGSIKADAAEILGASRIVYRPRKPLGCGARLWIETTAEVILPSSDRSE
jgi:hypothetical protein